MVLFAKHNLKEFQMATAIITAFIVTFGITAAIVPVFVGLMHHHRDEAEKRKALALVDTPVLVAVA
jgi:hypothetical protein